MQDEWLSLFQLSRTLVGLFVSIIFHSMRFIWGNFNEFGYKKNGFQDKNLFAEVQNCNVDFWYHLKNAASKNMK